MSFQVTILGCGSATPTLYRNPTSQLLEINSSSILIDCGEGTQLQLRKNKLKIQKIDHIFISHLHGDHYLGLPGLIASMSLLGRNKTLNLYGPLGLEQLIMTNLKISKTYLNFHINFTTTQVLKNEILLENKNITVTSFPVNHRIDCTGFIFKEQERQRNIIKSKIDEFNLGIAEIVCLKKGENVIRDDGSTIRFEDVTLPPVKPKVYAFCTDTKFSPHLADYFRGADVLYHEATFLDELKKRAEETFHSTALQAGEMAKAAQVKKLVIGHYSSRYIDVSPLLEEAQAVFANTVASEDGLVVKI